MATYTNPFGATPPAPTGGYQNPFSATPAPAPTPVTPSLGITAPSNNSTTPLASNLGITKPIAAPTPAIPASALAGSLGGGYGAATDVDPASGKPLLTYENQSAESSQLLSDRIAPTFDPTVAQKIDPATLLDPRMKEAVSQSIKSSIGGSSYQELDHIMPLELGGSNNKSNLRLEPAINTSQPYSASNPTPTDALENSIKTQVTSGKISLVQGWTLMAQAKGMTLPEQGGANPPASQIQNDKDVLPSKATAGDYAMTAAPSTMSTLADLQTNPLSLGSSLKTILTTPFTDVTKAKDTLGTAIANFITGLKNNDSASQDVGNALSMVSGGAGFALSPITSLFDTASKIPILGSISKLVFNLPFSLLGDAGGDIGMGLVNQLPISAQAKQNLEPGIKAIFGLAAQLGAGSVVVPDVIGTLTDTFGAKDANTIVTKAQELATEAKENPPPPPEGPSGTTAPAPTEEPNAQGTIAPKQDTQEVDLSNARQPSPINEIIAPENKLSMQDTVLQSLSPKPQPTADILPPKTPVTVEGSDASYKITSDTGGKSVKVVDLSTGDEETVPKTSVSKVVEPSDEVVKPKVRVTGGLKPVEGTGEFSNFKLSKNVEASTIENGLADSLGDLPGSKSIDMKDQAKKVADYINENPDEAKEVAMGRKNAPKGILPMAVFKAFTDIARTDGDGELAKDLANSELAGQARTMGQNIQALRGVNPEDPTEAIRELQESREKAKAKELATETQKASDAIKKATSNRTSGKVKMDWNSFVDSIAC